MKTLKVHQIRWQKIIHMLTPLKKMQSDDDLRDKIKNLEFDYNDVEDLYFQDYIKEFTEGKG